jgi:ribosome biogenesis GTPase
LSAHPLARLGWRADLDSHLHALGDAALVPARVTAVDRGRAVVDTGAGAWSAPLAGRPRRAGAAPATGDFVAVLPEGPVRAVLPRSGVIARRGDRGRPEVLAANVDLALLATSANRDLNPRRVARFIAITARGAVDAVVLLTKADLAADAPALAATVQAGLDGTPVVPVSVPGGVGLGAVRALLGPGRTAVLLGTSGEGLRLRRRRLPAAAAPADPAPALVPVAVGRRAEPGGGVAAGRSPARRRGAPEGGRRLRRRRRSSFDPARVFKTPVADLDGALTVCIVPVEHSSPPLARQARADGGHGPGRAHHRLRRRRHQPARPAPGAADAGRRQRARARHSVRQRGPAWPRDRARAGRPRRPHEGRGARGTALRLREYG